MMGFYEGTQLCEQVGAVPLLGIDAFIPEMWPKELYLSRVQISPASASFMAMFEN